MKRYYLDNNATTFLDPQVLQVMTQALAEFPGNPSSIHRFGQEARSQLEAARAQIATTLGVRPTEIIFTSGGTEALNLTLRGALTQAPAGEILTSSVEHVAVLETLEELTRNSRHTLIKLPVGLHGAVTPEELARAITPKTRLITLMAVNNETGVKTDIPAIAEIAQAHAIPLIVDGIAWLGKEPVTISAGVSAICFSGHKLHAPKGVGFAIVRKTLRLTPYLTGGTQEQGRRGGTENLPAIIALAAAVKLLNTALPTATAHMTSLRDTFESALQARLPGLQRNGSGPRICNSSNLSFPDVEGEVLLMQLDLHGIAASHGSACSSGALEPSRVLLEMGLPRARAQSSVRFSLSRFTTQADIDAVVPIIADVVQQLHR